MKLYGTGAGGAPFAAYSTIRPVDYQVVVQTGSLCAERALVPVNAHEARLVWALQTVGENVGGDPLGRIKQLSVSVCAN